MREFPIYKLPSGEKLVVPRVVARTTSIVRNVVAAPPGYVFKTNEEAATEEDAPVDA